MKLTVNQLRRIIKEEVQKVLVKEMGTLPMTPTEVEKKLSSMFGPPGPDDDNYREAAGIISNVLKGLDGGYSPVYNPAGELESALSMTPAGFTPSGGTDEVMKTFFRGAVFDDG